MSLFKDKNIQMEGNFNDMFADLHMSVIVLLALSVYNSFQNTKYKISHLRTITH